MNYFRHLFLQFLCFRSSHIGKVLTLRGIDDATRGIHQQADIARNHAVFAYFLKTAALGTNTGDQQEMTGGYLADILEHLSLCGTDDVHHIVFVAPLLACSQYLLKETFTLSILY